MSIYALLTQLSNFIFFNKHYFSIGNTWRFSQNLIFNFGRK